MADREIAVVAGVGPALGAALGRVFAGEGMGVALAARRADGLEPFVEEINGIGGEGRAYACDVSSESDVDSLFATVRADFGDPDIVVFNAGTFVFKGILETTAAEFEECWRIGCLGGFHVGRAAARVMAPRGSGSILFTGATASLRGGARFHNLAVPKFGLRALAQSMAREFGKDGVHVAHVVIDGQILSERWAEVAKDKPEDGLLAPDAIALNYLALHRQPRSAWTHEIDLRPWSESF